MSNARRLNLVVVSAGTSVPSSTRMLADRLTTDTRDALERGGQEVSTTVLEVRELAHEVVDATITRFPGESLKAAIDALGSADGIIATTPIYNQSFSGLFKSLFDVVEPGTLAGVPVALGATGGTARHSLAIDYALRPMFAYLKADVVPTTVFAASEDFGAVTTTADEDSLGARRRHRRCGGPDPRRRWIRQEDRRRRVRRLRPDGRPPGSLNGQCGWLSGPGSLPDPAASTPARSVPSSANWSGSGLSASKLSGRFLMRLFIFRTNSTVAIISSRTRGMPIGEALPNSGPIGPSL